MATEEAARDIRLGAYASWSDAEGILRCYQEFRSELDRPLDLVAVLAGMGGGARPNAGGGIW